MRHTNEAARRGALFGGALALALPGAAVEAQTGGAASQATSAVPTAAATAPRVANIWRHSPGDSLTNADSVRWRIGFSEDVVNVGTNDFTVTGTGLGTPTVTVAQVSASDSTLFEVAARGGSLAGLNADITLNFVASPTIQDEDGNSLTNTTSTGLDQRTYTIDNTRPRADSIMRLTSHNAGYTNADAVEWRVTFSEDVTGVGSGDFQVTGTGIGSVTIATDDAGDSDDKTYDVTASAGNLAGLTATVTLEFNSGGYSISDEADNDLTQTGRTGTNDNTFHVDNTRPRLDKIEYSNPSSSPTNANSVTWKVTFDEPVSGVGANDFGVSGASLTVTSGDFGDSDEKTYGVVASGSALNNLNGTITLGMAGSYTVSDRAGNSMNNANVPSGNTDESAWVIDNTRPALQKVERQNPSSSPTNADEVTWRLTWNEDMATPSAGDFRKTGGNSNVSLSVSDGGDGDAATWDVKASGGNLANLNNTITLGFASSHGLADAAGNGWTTATPSPGPNNNSFVIDNTLSFNMTGVPSSSNGRFTARFTFGEAVTGFASDDITVTGASKGSLDVVTASRVWEMDITATADYTVDVRANAATDAAGNGNVTRSASGSFDNTNPRIASITRKSPTRSPTTADSAIWLITFSENVRNVDRQDFALNWSPGHGAGSIVETVGNNGDNDPKTYTFKVANDTRDANPIADYDGTLTLTVRGGNNIQDAAGNRVTNTTPTGANNNTFVFDNTAPSVTITGVPASTENDFRVTFTFNERVRGFHPRSDVTLEGLSFSSIGDTVSADSTWFRYGLALDDGLNDGDAYSVELRTHSVTDLVGLTGPTARTKVSGTYSGGDDDTTAPRVASVTRSSPTGSRTSADEVTWLVTFNEAVRNVGAADFSVTGTGAGSVTETVGDNDDSNAATYTVKASGGNLANLNAQITLSFATGYSIEDLAGNDLTNTTPTGTNNNTYTIDNTRPTLSISGVPSSTSSGFTATFAFSESVTGFAVSDISLTNLTAGAMTGSGASYSLPLTLAGGLSNGDAYRVSVAAGSATDGAGLTGPPSAVSASGSYSGGGGGDTTPPMVQSVSRSSPSTSPTNADSVTWRVTFDEAVTGVGASDFAVTGGGSVTINVTDGGDGSAATYDVTASGGDLAELDGTVTLAFAASPTIQDNAGNALTDASLSGSTTFELDNTAPTVTITGVPDATDAPFVVTLSFSETVTGFDADDVAVTGGEAGALTEEAADSAWTLVVTPTEDYAVSVAADAATDIAGNPGPTEAAEASGTFSATGIVASPRSLSLAEGGSGSFEVSLGDSASATVTVSVASGDANAVAVSPALLTFEVGAWSTPQRVDVSAPHDDDALDETVSVTLTASGGGYEGQSTTVAVTVTDDDDDGVDPGLSSIERVGAPGGATNSDLLRWRVRFSEPVMNVDGSDFVVEGAPGATITAVPDAQGAAALGVGGWSGSGAGAAPNADKHDVSAAWLVTASGGGLADLNGTVRLRLAPGNDIADAGGNAVGNPDPTDVDESEVEVDNIAPSVSISGVPSRSGPDPFTASVEFSEPVEGFGADDVETVNAVVLEVSGSGAAYSARVGPGRDGAFTLRVAAGATTDSAGNANPASATVSGAWAGTNMAPMFEAEAYAFDLPENATGYDVGAVAAVDADGDALGYALFGADAARFSVDATGSVTYAGPGEDFEAGPAAYSFMATASDSPGLADTTAVTVTVVDVNEAPAFEAESYAFELAEGLAGPVELGMVLALDPDAGAMSSYALIGDRAARFSVDASGTVRYTGPGEDFEAGTAYDFMATATDARGLADTAAVAVTVVDVNEGPIFETDAYAFDLPENAPGPVEVGRVRALDPDANARLYYALVGDGAARFWVDASGTVRYAGPGEDFETGPQAYHFMATTMDASGLADTTAVTVTVVDVNEGPMFETESYAFELAEGMAGPVDVGAVRAFDPDGGAMSAYALIGDGAERFSVDASGVVGYAGPGEDFEAGPTAYAFMAAATDTGGLSDTAAVTVAIRDANDAPETVGEPAPVELQVDGSTEVELGTLFSDPDGDVLTYSAESVSEVLALVDGSTLALTGLAEGEAAVVVRATDPDGLWAEQRVAVTVARAAQDRAGSLEVSLQAFGRSIGTETVEALGSRFGMGPLTGGGSTPRAETGSHLAVAGRRLSCNESSGAGCGATDLLENGAALLGYGGMLSAARSVRSFAQGALEAGGLLGGGAAPRLPARPSLRAAGAEWADPTRSGAVLGSAAALGGGATLSGYAPDGGRSASLPRLPSVGLGRQGGIGAGDLADGTSFQFSTGGAGGAGAAQNAPGGWTVWGRAGLGSFQGSPESDLTLDGETQSAHLGLDHRFGSSIVFGLLGSRTLLDLDFDDAGNAGAVEARMTSVQPYVSVADGGLSLWGAGGMGWGTADLTDSDGTTTSDLSMVLGAFGFAQRLAGALGLKGDAFLVNIESEDAGDVAGVTARAQRVRLAPSLGVRVGGAATKLAVSVEAGLRSDRGDLNGEGAETAGEIAFEHAPIGLSIAARGRLLVAHTNDSYEEWGASASLRIGPRGGSGLSMSVLPEWGDGGGGVGGIWAAGPSAFGAGRPSSATGRGGGPAGGLGGAAGSWRPARVRAEVGYALAAAGGLLEPFGRWSGRAGEVHGFDAGARLHGPAVTVDLYAQQGLGPSGLERRLTLEGRIGLR